MDQRGVIADRVEQCFAFIVGTEIDLGAGVLANDVFPIVERSIARQLDIAKEAVAIHAAIAFIELKPVVEDRGDEAILGFW